MKAVTLRIFRRTDGQLGHALEFFEGAPGQQGARLAPLTVLPDDALDANAIKRLEDLRNGLLTQTGRIAKIDERATELGRLLLSGAVGTAWKTLMAAAIQDVAIWSRQRDGILRDRTATEEQRRWAMEHPGYRTYLQIDDPQLDWIPWELARSDGTLFLQADVPIMRYRVIEDGREPWKPEWQIRVLLVVAADNRASIGADEEVRSIRRALRPLDRIYDVDVLYEPDRASLFDRLKEYQPHILHFIGHGSGKNLQLFNGAANIPWGATEITNDISSKSWVPEVAYLNACRSQGVADWNKATAADLERQRGIVDALLGRGVLAVVAMQADVRGKAAGLCAAEFYRALVDGEPIDAALTWGRTRIAQVVEGKEDAREPYLPVLTVTVPADQILRHRSSRAEVDCGFARQHLEAFVDRVDERRLIVRAIRDQKHVIVLQGGPEMGKSWLLSWAIDACLRRFCAVRYLELGGCANWLEVLRALRDGHPRVGGIQAPLGDLLSASFNWKLTQLARGQVEPAGSPDLIAADKAGPLDKIVKSRKTPPEFVSHACRAFHDALSLGSTKLVIVMDQLEMSDMGISAADFSLLRKHWIDPYIARGDGRVNVLLAIRSDRLRDYGLEPVPTDYRTVAVDQFRAADSKELLGELFWLRLEQHAKSDMKLEKASMLQRMEQELAEYPDEPGTGRDLRVWLEGLWTTCRKKVKARPHP